MTVLSRYCGECALYSWTLCRCTMRDFAMLRQFNTDAADCSDFVGLEIGLKLKGINCGSACDDRHEWRIHASNKPKTCNKSADFFNVPIAARVGWNSNSGGID